MPPRLIYFLHIGDYTRRNNITNMHFFKNMDPKLVRGLKAAGVVFVAVIVLALVSGALGKTGNVRYGGGWGADSVMPSAPAYEYDESSKGYGVAMPTLSARNVATSYPQDGGYTSGNDAEEFEVTEYSATIEATDSDDVCADVLSLKDRDYVVFEYSNSYDKGCSHTFKVAHANVDEVLAFIKELDPRDLSENIQTIKQTAEDYTSQTEILKKKLDAVESTLSSALAAYDEIARIATRANDADALAKIVNGKVGTIERLTQERININSQLEFFARAKARELDRLDYTYFRVNVYENKYVDGTSIKDSWKQAVRDFVYNLNRIIQAVTVGLVGFVLLAVQYLIYIAILIVIAKYGRKYVRDFWNK